MAQFQAYRNSRGSREEVPFLLDVQSNLIQTGSRLVVPLVLATRYGLLYTRLNPGFTVDGIKVIAAVSDLAAIDERELRMVVADLSAHRDTLMQAIDFLITGY
ncbi:CcdB family protein [Solimonas sp. K1W22B-7]|uniref:CcdB family protein n=1 Tax=Solimonas sp. K1W22B-7 TaxID=2303331 RepID=UPI0013C3E675|nr:CcdB family protein [Solimonas sp. K1W22B-7]